MCDKIAKTTCLLYVGPDVVGHEGKTFNELLENRFDWLNDYLSQVDLAFQDSDTIEITGDATPASPLMLLLKDLGLSEAFMSVLNATPKLLMRFKSLLVGASTHYIDQGNVVPVRQLNVVTTDLRNSWRHSASWPDILPSDVYDIQTSKVSDPTRTWTDHALSYGANNKLPNGTCYISFTVKEDYFWRIRRIKVNGLVSPWSEQVPLIRKY